MMAARLDHKLTGEAFSTSLPPIPALRQSIQGLVPDIGGFEALSRSAGKVWSAKSSAMGRQEAMPPEELQEVLWKQFFADTTQWWDNRRTKPTSRHPDFRHKVSKFPLWLDNRHKPVWVDSQLATIDAGLKTTPKYGSPVQGPGAFAAIGAHLEVEMCRKLCEDGLISDAVDALDLLVQQGCQVPNNLFYRLLKRCIQDKDLVLGRHIHSLTVQSGYEGDAFLATHLIGLYALHGRLDEAMGVFTKISTPDAYNWATIIFAYAKHGEATEAAEAIRLYRQMCESSTVKPDDRIYSAVLKACTAARDLVAGKEVHGHILASRQKPDRFVQAGLVNMYAKCGSLEDARRVFDKLSNRDAVTWTAMIAGYTQHGLGVEALKLYSSMQQEGFTPDCVTFVCLLQACASVGIGALGEGKQLHAQIKKQRLQVDMVLGGSLVNMYAKCGSIEDACIVFNKLAKRDVVTWTVMIAGYAKQGMGEEALSLYRGMQEEGLNPPDCVTYVCLLQACASVGVGALHEGKQLHAIIKEQGLQQDVLLGGSLVNMYAKCGCLEDARSMFDELPKKNSIAWNAMIAGYAQQGMGHKALDLYRNMQQEGLTPPDCVTYVCLLQACASEGVGARHAGEQLHAQINKQGLQQDLVVQCSLVNMYANCGSLVDARRLFDTLPEKDIVSCNAMISGYVLQGMDQDALDLYGWMQLEGRTPPNSVTYVYLLQACSSIGVAALHEGKQLHAQIEARGLQEDVVLCGSMVNMYAKCGSLEDARRLFEKLPQRNAMAWNAMIAGYAQQGKGQEALSLYSSMEKEGLTPDCVTYVCLLQACAIVGVGALCDGKLLHAQIKKRRLQVDVVLGGSLVNMYAKCGSLEDACLVFNKLAKRDIITWTAMIAGYAQQGMGQEALSLYSSMQQEGIIPNSVTYVCLLQACAAVAGLPLGEQLHAEIEERGIQADCIVGAALVNMYAKCGSMYSAQRVFDSLTERSIKAWGALVSGYARQGDSQAVFDLLDRMRLEGISPNEIMFLSVLTVCSHVGLVDEGRKYFEAMRTDYGISATVEHFICMVDLLGRAGHLDEALQMAKTMPFPPNVVLWHTLLGACWKWKNVEIGQDAFNCAVSVDDKDAASYVLMSNIYASAGMWEAAKEMQARRMILGAWKIPGQSWWTDMDGVVHTFLVGDKNRPVKEGADACLKQLVNN